MNCCSPVVVGRQRRSALTVLQRHRHAESYLALVLSGGYEEAGDFEVGGSTFHRIIARYVEDKEGSFSSRTEAGNIGTEVLANFTLDFDYANNVIWFKSVSGFTPSPFSRSGMSLYRDSPGSLVVVNTVPGGPADLAGIRAGDAIVSIADKSTTAMMSRELMRTFTQAAGTKVPIVYRRKGQQETATIELKELLPQ
jgi:C-terminal processing protease CtpA/Prc